MSEDKVIVDSQYREQAEKALELEKRREAALRLFEPIIREILERNFRMYYKEAWEKHAEDFKWALSVVMAALRNDDYDLVAFHNVSFERAPRNFARYRLPTLIKIVGDPSIRKMMKRYRAIVHQQPFPILCHYSKLSAEGVQTVVPVIVPRYEQGEFVIDSFMPKIVQKYLGAAKRISHENVDEAVLERDFHLKAGDPIPLTVDLYCDD